MDEYPTEIIGAERPGRKLTPFWRVSPTLWAPVCPQGAFCVRAPLSPSPSLTAWLEPLLQQEHISCEEGRSGLAIQRVPCRLMTLQVIQPAWSQVSFLWNRINFFSEFCRANKIVKVNLSAPNRHCRSYKLSVIIFEGSYTFGERSSGGKRTTEVRMLF